MTKSMNQTPRANRLHIAICGRRNAGKSSLINALTNQNVAIVSDVPGTTADPVYKSMEMLPLGPVVIIDTAGLDDTGKLGELRVQKTKETLRKADMVILVIDATRGTGQEDKEIADFCRTRGLPLVIAANKADAVPDPATVMSALRESLGAEPILVSALTRTGISDLKIAILHAAPTHWDDLPIIGDLLQPGDIVVLVVPIDLAAPKGRLILPQVQTIRDVLDHDAMAYVVKERELKECLNTLQRKPKLVVTDSQAFLKADADTPPDVLLTSFSILFARHKGDLSALVSGSRQICRLKPGDRILIAEGCTHHRVEDDIGTVKIPRWLRQYVGGELDFVWTSGSGFPADLKSFSLVVHCGGCMLNRREMMARIFQAQEAGVPIVNYGVCIAFLKGILPRALSPFPALRESFNDWDFDE